MACADVHLQPDPGTANRLRKRGKGRLREIVLASKLEAIHPRKLSNSLLDNLSIPNTRWHWRCTGSLMWLHAN